MKFEYNFAKLSMAFICGMFVAIAILTGYMACLSVVALGIVALVVTFIVEKHNNADFVIEE